MRRRFARVASPVAILLVVAFAATACGSDAKSTSSSNTTTAGGTTPTTVKEAPISATLNAAGSTFVKPFLDTVIASYKSFQSGVTINYAGGGSGAGRTQLAGKVIDFAGTDALVSDADKAAGLTDYLYFPTVAAPVTMSYNLPDVKDLTLDGDTIAKIFQRQIKKWDDPAIAALNPGQKMPSTDIVVVHRSDSSGTTDNFTKYLASAAPNTWTLKSGSTVEWPADTQAGNGNAGVAQVITQNNGAIGYVDLSDAKAAKLTFAKVKNKAGTALAPTVDGAAAAVVTATVNADLTYAPQNADGTSSYPITAPTYILVYKTQTDHNKGLAIKSFLKYLLTTGQDTAASVDYAKLSPALQQKAIAQLDQIVVP